MKREYVDYLQDILNSMNDAEKFVENMSYQEFVNDKKTIFAVIRALEIIGEAVKNIPESVIEKHPDIPWKDMRGMRDKLIHEYFGVNLKVVWDTVKIEIPEVKSKFQKIVENLTKHNGTSSDYSLKGVL